MAAFDSGPFLDVEIGPEIVFDVDWFDLTEFLDIRRDWLQSESLIVDIRQL